jgi:hypothetical protein
LQCHPTQAYQGQQTPARDGSHSVVVGDKVSHC